LGCIEHYLDGRLLLIQLAECRGNPGNQRTPQGSEENSTCQVSDERSRPSCLEPEVIAAFFKKKRNEGKANQCPRSWIRGVILPSKQENSHCEDGN
jgi:hypothetical protein